MAHGEDFDPSNYRRYELINKIFHYGIRDAEFDSVSTGRTVIGSDGTTTDASLINQAIQDAEVGSTVYFSGTIDGQIVLDKDVNLIGAGAQLQSDPSDLDAGPFAATGVNGSVIDTTGSSDACLHIEGFRSGVVIGGFGLRPGTGPGMRTDKGVASESPRLFWSNLNNIYVYEPGDGEFGFDMSNVFKTNIYSCHSTRSQNGIRIQNEESDTWNYGHINLYNCFVDINRSGGVAYKFESVNSRLDFVRLYGTHAISEGPVTTDWTGYYFDEILHPEINAATVEACDTGVYARLTTFSGVPTFSIGSGEIDDGRDNVYHDVSAKMSIVNNGFVRERSMPETHGINPVTSEVTAGQPEENIKDFAKYVTVQMEKPSGTTGRIDATLAVNDTTTNLSTDANLVEDGIRTPQTSDRINNFMDCVVPIDSYYQINSFGDGQISAVAERPIA